LKCLHGNGDIMSNFEIKEKVTKVDAVFTKSKDFTKELDSISLAEL